MDNNNQNHILQEEQANTPTPESLAQNQKEENMLNGIIGGFLFSLGGALTYFIIYQLGFIAGICGFLMFFLAKLGYGLFSGVKNTKKGVIVAIIIPVLMIPVAEYFSVSYEIYSIFNNELGFEVSFFDACREIPEFLKDSEVLISVIKDIAIAYVLTAVASFQSIKASFIDAKTTK